MIKIYFFLLYALFTCTLASEFYQAYDISSIAEAMVSFVEDIARENNTRIYIPQN